MCSSRSWKRFVCTIICLATTLISTAVKAGNNEQSQSSTLRSESKLSLTADTVTLRVSYSEHEQSFTQVSNLSDYPIFFVADASGKETYVGAHGAVVMPCASASTSENGTVRINDSTAEFNFHVEALCGDLIEIVGHRVYPDSQELAVHNSDNGNQRPQIAAATDDLYFDGTVSFTVSGNTVRMTADGICNGRNGGTSGTLYWRIRFTTQATPAGSGYSGGEVRLDPLEGEYCYKNLDRTISFTQPPAGVYYVHFTLYEYPETNTIVDSRTFPNTVTFVSGGGGTGSGNNAGDFYFDGTVSYTISNGTVRMQANGICNGNASGTSGTLYWRIRFTTQSTPVGDGYNGGEVSLDPLQAGYCYTNLDRTVSYSAPPSGTYQVHFTLYEYPEINTIIASRTFSDTLVVSGNSGSGGGSGGGGGGGGAIREIELLTLFFGSLLMMFLRKRGTSATMTRSRSADGHSYLS